MLNPPRFSQIFLLLALAGSLVGTTGDALHVATQTLGYPDLGWPLLPTGQPLWVPFEFAAAGLSIGIGHWGVTRLLKQRAPKGLPGVSARKTLLGGTLFLLVVWGTSGILPLPEGGPKELALAGVAALSWLAFDRTLLGIVLASATAAIGTGVEIALVRYGQFYYLPQHSRFYGVPSWLPFLYIVAATVTARITAILLVPKRPLS